MNVEQSRRKIGYVLAVASVLAYFARPLSCSFVLRRFSPDDPLPYAHFDYHGFGALSAWAMAFVYALPILWLTSRVFIRDSGNSLPILPERDVRITSLSIFLSLALGAPMHSQIAYLIGLPVSVSFPVLISSLTWLLIVELGRRTALKTRPLDRKVVGVAIVTTVLITLPKLALVGYTISQR